MPRNNRKSFPAFTLVEMMMVIAIIGILAAIIYPLGSMYLSQARDTSRQNAILQLARAHEAYFTDYNAYPTRNTQEGRENCVSTDLTSGHVSYIKQLPISPLGEKYNEGCGPNGHYAYGVNASANLATLMSTMEGKKRGNYNGDPISTNNLLGNLNITPQEFLNLNSSLTPKSGKYYIHTLGYIEADDENGNNNNNNGNNNGNSNNHNGNNNSNGNGNSGNNGNNNGNTTPPNNLPPRDPCTHPIQRHENGVTIQASSCAVGGRTYDFEGSVYYVVDSKQDLKNQLERKQYPTNRLVTTRVTDMSGIFEMRNHSCLQSRDQISNWDTSNVTDMSRMFVHCAPMASLSKWDVSQVKDMSGMMHAAQLSSSLENDDLSQWNTVNVENMSNMFAESNFNGNISTWDTSKVMNMLGMFSRNSKFNQPIGNWNTSSVKNMASMFAYTDKFNQPISDWNTSNVKNMSSMFTSAKAFNRSLAGWDVSQVMNMSHMFWEAPVFNGSLDGWNPVNVVSLERMFDSASRFNQPLLNWDLKKAHTLDYMFYRARAFNSSVTGWKIYQNPHPVWGHPRLLGVFSNATSFNQPLDSWEIHGNYFVTNSMFAGASAFRSSVPRIPRVNPADYGDDYDAYQEAASRQWEGYCSHIGLSGELNAQNQCR